MSDPRDGFEVVAEYPDATTVTYPDIAEYEADGLWVRFVSDGYDTRVYTSDEPVGPWTDIGLLPAGVGPYRSYVNGVWFAIWGDDGLVRSTDLQTWTRVQFSGFAMPFLGDSGTDPNTDDLMVAGMPSYDPGSGRWWTIAWPRDAGPSSFRGTAIYIVSSTTADGTWTGDDASPLMELTGTDTEFDILALNSIGVNGSRVWVSVQALFSLDRRFAYANSPTAAWTEVTLDSSTVVGTDGNGYWARAVSAGGGYDIYWSNGPTPEGAETQLALDVDTFTNIVRFWNGVWLFAGYRDDAIVVFAGETPEALEEVDFEITASPAYIYEELYSKQGWLLSAYSDPDATFYYLIPGAGGGEGWGLIL